MFSCGRMLVLRTLTHTRVGAAAGEDGLDLPLCRDAGGEVFLPFSAVRGAVRSQLRGGEAAWHQRCFGEGGHRSSLLSFTDQTLLLWPVATGEFRLWATSPRALAAAARWRRLLDGGAAPAVPQAAEGEALAARAGRLELAADVVAAQASPQVAAWEEALTAWCGLPLAGRLVVVADGYLGALSRAASQVAPRLRLKEETRSVAKGAFWYEEYLPEDAVFLGGVLALEPRLYDGQTEETAAQLLETLAGRLQPPLALGAATSRGGGLVQARLLSAAETAGIPQPPPRPAGAAAVQDKQEKWQRQQAHNKKRKKR